MTFQRSVPRQSGPPLSAHRAAIPAASAVAWLVPVRYACVWAGSNHDEKIDSPKATRSTGSPAGMSAGEKSEGSPFGFTDPMAMMELQFAGRWTPPVPLSPLFPAEAITSRRWLRSTRPMCS